MGSSALFSLPRLYAILDRHVLLRQGIEVVAAAEQLRDAGCTLLQYRNKVDAPAEVLSTAVRLRTALSGSDSRLLLNDRVDLARLADCDGVHVGQTDLAPAEARRVLGPGKVVGLSTHTLEQVKLAGAEPVDYIALGPIFATDTKTDADPVVGLEMLRKARRLTNRPLVGIGGITCGNAARVIEAGADSVAVIGALFAPGESLAGNALRLLRELR